MSATLANIDDLLKFLDAQFYEERFRPVENTTHLNLIFSILISMQVELEEYVKVNDTVYKIDRNNHDQLIEHRQLDFKVCFKDSFYETK